MPEETTVCDDERLQLWVMSPEEESWKEFLAQNNRSFENEFVGSLISIYNSFSGFYSWERDSDEVSKVAAPKKRPASDFLVKLVTPDTWKDFETCIEEQKTYVELQSQGERPRGVILKDREGRYFIQGLQLSDYADEDIEEDAHSDEEYGLN